MLRLAEVEMVTFFGSHSQKESKNVIGEVMANEYS